MIQETFLLDLPYKYVQKILRFLRLRYKKFETSERNINTESIKLISKHIHLIKILCDNISPTTMLFTTDESNFEFGDSPKNS